MNSIRCHPEDYIHHLIASLDRYTCTEAARRQPHLRDQLQVPVLQVLAEQCFFLRSKTGIQ